MATMHPSVFPGQAEPDNPEFTAYQVLRKLPEHYDVFYSKKFKGSDRFKDECEVDFLVFDGKSALLCIEVKGGLLDYDDGEQVWRQNGERMRRMPDRQASATVGPVIEHLGRDAGALNVQWGLFFPQCCRPSGEQLKLLPGLLDAQIIDQADMLDIEPAIERMTAYAIKAFGRRGVTKQERHAIISRLTRSVHFVQRVGVRVASDYQQLVEVTTEQLAVLEDLVTNDRMVVRGCAGSGKTLLAQEFARRLSAQGKCVLLLFYNRVIANTARQGFERDSSVECTTFHSLARKLIANEDPDWWPSQARGADDFWTLNLPSRLLDVTIGKEKYDAIIVDEGQDFKREWFEFLSQLLNDGSDRRFVVFYDERQDIFGHWQDLPWGGDGVARKVLTKNCRNTRRIVRYIKGISGCEMDPFDASPEGLEVVCRQTATVEEEKQQLVADVTGLLKQGVEPGQMVFLLNGRHPESSIADVDDIDGTPVVWVGRSLRETSKAIRYASISIFKGLEADVVFVLGCSGMDTDKFSRTIYVEGSRARTLLYIYGDRSQDEGMQATNQQAI